MSNDQLTITLNADTLGVQKAEKELDKLEKSVYSVKNAVNESSGAWSKYSSVITACSTSFMAVRSAVQDFVIAPLSAAINQFAALGDQISKASQRVGMGVETLGGLKFAAEQCGANFQILTDGIKAFQNQLGAAQMGDAGAIGKLGKVGLSADAFAGLSNEDQLMKVADHIKSIGDKAEQTRVSMELFGKAGFKLLPFFQEGSEGIQKLIAEGKDIGAVLGEEAAEDAVKMTDAMNRVKTSAVGISNVFISSLAPSIISVLDGATQLAKTTSKFVKDYGPVVHGIGSAVAAFALLKGIMLSTTTVIPALVAGFNALKVAMLSNPYLLAGAAIIGGIVAAWSLWNRKIHETEEALRSMNEEAVKHEQAVKAANAADQKLFDRLQELADIEDPLSNNEIREAQMLIDELEGKYGKLGITIDATTGKINGMAQAQAILNREMAQKEIDALEERKKALEARRGALSKEITEKYKKYGHLWDEEALKRQGLSLNGRGKAEKERQEERKKEFRAVNEEIAGLIARQNALRGITNPETGATETREQLKESNIAERSETEAAKKELEGMGADTDLMDPLQKQFYELDQKYLKKSAALNKKMALAQKAGRDTSSISNEFNALEQWRQDEMAKIMQGQTAEQDRKASADYAAWKERNPELEKPEGKDSRVSAAEAKVQAARQKQADAILSGGDLVTADAELKAANEELAKAVVESSGEARGKAAEELAAAQAKYDQAKRDGKDNKTLNDLLDVVKKAQEKYNTENERYFNAVGQLRQENEADVQDVVQTTLSSSGTFSAYGLDAVATSDIPKQTLEVLKKLLDNTDEIKKEQKNDAAYTEE